MRLSALQSFRNSFLPFVSKEEALSLLCLLRDDAPELRQCLTVRDADDGLQGCLIAHVLRLRGLSSERSIDVGFTAFVSQDEAMADFLEWFDETPRQEMRNALLYEFESYLKENEC